MPSHVRTTFTHTHTHTHTHKHEFPYLTHGNTFNPSILILKKQPKFLDFLDNLPQRFEFEKKQTQQIIVAKQTESLKKCKNTFLQQKKNRKKPQKTTKNQKKGKVCILSFQNPTKSTQSSHTHTKRKNKNKKNKK